MLNQIGLFLALVGFLAILTGVIRLGYEVCVIRKCKNEAEIALAKKKKANMCFTIGYPIAAIGMLLGIIAHNL